MEKKPWWAQKTFWAFVGTCVATGLAVVQHEMTLNAAVPIIFAAIGSLTARAGAMEQTETVVDALPANVRAAVLTGVAARLGKGGGNGVS